MLWLAGAKDVYSFKQVCNMHLDDLQVPSLQKLNSLPQIHQQSLFIYVFVCDSKREKLNHTFPKTSIFNVLHLFKFKKVLTSLEFPLPPTFLLPAIQFHMHT